MDGKEYIGLPLRHVEPNRFPPLPFLPFQMFAPQREVYHKTATLSIRPIFSKNDTMM